MMAGRSKALTVGLLWHSVNSGNLGVGALTVSNLALARESAAEHGLDVRFVVIGFVDDGPSYVKSNDVSVLRLDTRAMLPFGAYWRELGHLDCILDIGGGDSFADIYGTKRFMFLWGTKAMALLRGVPLMLSPQTIGPFDRQPQAALAGTVMNRAAAVVARDPVSFEVAQSLAPRARVVQAVDVAFALPFERQERSAEGSVKVGINVSGLLFNEGYTGANEFGLQISYADFTRKLIEAFLAEPGVSVRLIAHVISQEIAQDDDRIVIDQLARDYPQVVRAPDFASPSEAKSYISGLDFLVAGRMHACIAAFSSGTPVVPVAYSRKFSGLFEGVLQYDHSVPVTGLDTEAAVEFTLERFRQRDELAAQIAKSTPVVEERLRAYRSQLGTFFQQVSRGRRARAAPAGSEPG
jgi:polysaccharide pyruvyl transferase WcaK-like protein